MQDIIGFIEEFENKLNSINSFKELLEIKKSINFEITEKNTINSEVSRHKLLFKKLLLKLINKVDSRLNNNTEDKEVIRLNSVLSRNMYTPKALNKLITLNALKNRDIGQIPYVFLKNIKHTDRKKCAKEIFNLCAKYSLELLFRDFTDYNHQEWMSTNRQVDMDLFAKKMSAIINNEVIIEYIGRGHNGNVYKIIIEDQAFVYKCFFPFSFHTHYQHGKNTEPQSAYYATKHEKNRFAKFYFGRVCSEYDYDGFIVAEFLERNTASFVQKKFLSLHDLCTYLSIDYSEARRYDNLINGKIVDYGALIEVQPELKNKNIKYMVNLILNNINYFHDVRQIKYVWKVNPKNIENIKNGIKKYNNYADYYKAVNFLKKYLKHFPQKLYSDLKKITKLKKNYVFAYEETINFESFFDSNIDNVLNVLKYFRLKNNHVICIPEIDMDGSISVSLFDNISAVINYNSNGVLNVRIEKQIENEFEVLFKANTPDDFAKFSINDI